MDLITEGAITFETEGAFYNPRMLLNRDINVAMTRSLGISDYLDALAASGIRGMRVAKEAQVEAVSLNDISPQACQLMEKNLARNALTASVTCLNANVLLHERHFQAVDLDPFGSPSSYLSAASRSAREYLFITATDTAPLCGAHLMSGIRKYMAVPLRTSYHREMGARILLGLVARELARLDKSMQPLLTHVTDHYVRIYLGVGKGAKAADRCLQNLGYVEHCFGCGSFYLLREPKGSGVCRRCSCKTTLAGPLWLGRIQDAAAIGKALNITQLSRRAEKILTACAAEIEAPMYYDHHGICERLSITPGRIDLAVDQLKACGFQASRTHFSGLGIKTDASMVDVEEAIRIS
ncbi:MAG: tRNA (guanine(10)-N(2))-dimethyltransferase [Methanothrix sp.]|nr:tRNA (guanine(10)-N(2))-dimethyltransferase [Methanothrix sp.]OYV11542.1 MAG: tRNA (guanine26-N2/guanine27-N2)-dimethyltransferase [Methanosaeta sp. ASM2]